MSFVLLMPQIVDTHLDTSSLFQKGHIKMGRQFVNHFLAIMFLSI